MSEVGGARAWILAFVLMVGVGIGGLITVGCVFGANACLKPRSRPSTTNGMVIFLGSCAVCHGRDGEGTRAAPALATGEATTLTLQQIETRIERGKPLGPRGSMPRFEGTLTPEQIRSVARYVVSLRGS